MKPFNLEAAKRGEPIVTNNGTPQRFIGVRSDGSIVTELIDGTLGIYAPHLLRMAPKKCTVWINFYGHTIASYHDTQEDADKASCGIRIGKAYPVEIEE